MKSVLHYSTLLILLFFNSLAIAHDNEPLFNQIHIRATVEREVANDQMQVMLNVEHQGRDPAALAELVNKDMQWALDKAKKYKQVESSTRSYQTHPIYKKQDVVGWRVSQELSLKSEDSTKLSKLIGVLQERLLVRQMSFSTTKATREKHENELIEEAMQAFKRKVAIVAKHMQEKSHRIVNLNINTGGHTPPVFMRNRAEVAFSSMAADVSRPVVESGSSTLSVTIDGSVQFF